MTKNNDKSIGINIDSVISKDMRISGARARLNLISIVIGLFIFVILASVGFVSAYERLCLTHGQSVPNDEDPRYTCFHDICQVCVTDSYNPTNPNKCNGIQGCQAFGNGSGIDQTPPEITVNSPVEGQVFNSRSVLFDLESNEPASFSYLDNINGRGRWRRLVSLRDFYTRELRLKDGLNDITIRAIDRKRNEATVDVTFFVDSKDPKIRRTEPRKGFANGDFYVQFTEANPEDLVLHYGNNAVGFRMANVDLNNCTEDRSRVSCNVNVNLDDYDGHDINYWFELTDVAGNTVNSKKVSLSVDIAPPVVLNPDNFWSQGIGRNQNKIYFDIEIDEENFDDVSYYDVEASRPNWKKICSRLRDGHCVKRVTFRRGMHTLDVQVTDEAGNAVSTERVEFEVF